MQKNKIYDAFISYSCQDSSFAHRLVHELNYFGVTTCINIDNLNMDDTWMNQIATAISSARLFIPIVTENSLASQFFKQESIYAVSIAKDRSKIIIPICFSFDVIQKNSWIAYSLGEYQFLKADDESDEEVKRIAEIIASYISNQKTENELFEKVVEYIKAGANNKATEVLCELITNICDQIQNGNPQKRRKLFYKLLPLFEKLYDIYDYDYGKDASMLAHKKLDVLEKAEKLLALDEFNTNDLFYISVALRLVYFDREIRWTSVDTITSGDLSSGQIEAVTESDYALKQQPFLQKYNSEMVIQNLENDNRYTVDELNIIHETIRYIYYTQCNKQPKPQAPIDKTKENELLFSVASFMKEGNKLFDIISEQQCADEFLRCLILSYERLQKYCEIVGEKRVCAECVDRIFELKEKLNTNNIGGRSNEKVEDGIKSLLGLTIPKSGNFDVFISHKKEDMDIASDMYDFLKNHLKEAFFDKYSLPEMSESKYRKAIMQALDGSMHFVVILSDLSYLNSYWVSLEMEIFQSEIDEGRKPNSNFMIIVTNNVYDQIVKTNKAVLPIEYRRCEIMRVDEYKTKLLSYLNKRS